MRVQTMLAAVLLLVAGCDSAPETTGGAAGAGAVGGSGGQNTTSTGGAAGGMGGAGGMEPSPWKTGIDDCHVSQGLIKGGTPYDGAFQALRPPPGPQHVTQLKVGVWESDNGGGPWIITWAVGPKADVGKVVFPTAPRIFEARKFETAEAEFPFPDPRIGVITWDVDFNTEEGELVLVHQSFTRPGDPPATITICTDPVDGGLDSYAVTGECPGPSCKTAVVDPLPPEATEALWVAASGD